MFDRFINLIKAMLNKGVSKLETPEMLAEQAQSELETSVKKVKEAITTALANEKMLEQSIQKNNSELQMWEQRAGVAVQQGNDDLAKQCLEKRQEFTQKGQQMTAQLAEQKRTSAGLKDRYTELQGKLKDFTQKRKELTTRAQAGEALAKASELLSSSSGSGMEKWEEKIREKEFKSQAVRELDGIGGPTDDKFKELDKNTALDDELAALKARMGAQPKLIVDSSSRSNSKDEEPILVEEIKPNEDKK